MRPTGRRFLGAFLGLGLAPMAGPVLAQGGEAAFVEQFNGEFRGGGAVRTQARSDPWNVDCDMTGRASATSLSFEGRCRTALIFSRRVGAQILIDANGVYSGTYIGSTIGPAAISGTRSGDTVALRLTWPEPVNGDTDATMTITATGDGFLFAVDDLDQPGGTTVRMTDIAMSRR